jgi:hypothetical protein
MVCNKEDNTLTFDELVKGWTSFHSFLPDFMTGVNNKFFSFKGGDLYLHNSDNVPRNTFYGVQYPSRVSVMVNESPSDIKELQAISLEGNSSWEALISAYVSNVDDAIVSSIKAVEFIKKEGIWFGYARRNESDVHFDSKSTYGIGEVTDISGTTITINGGSKSLTFGDTILIGNDLSTVGTVISHNTSSGVTTIVVSSVGSLVVGNFVFGMKSSRIEGGNLRGYTMRVDLENTSDTKLELFAVNAEVIKSYSS